jgi:type VI secretion system FHA domain protein
MGFTLRVRYLGSIEATRDEVVAVRSERYTIGRRPSNDLHLPDRSRHISGEHAVLEKAPEGYYLTDTSQNGLLVNGTPTPRGEPHWLRDGDELRIGEYQLLCRVQAAEDPLPVSDRGGGVDRFRDPLELLSGAAGAANRRGDPGGGSEAPSTDPFDLVGQPVDDPFAGLPGPQPPSDHRPSDDRESSATAGRPTGDFFERPRLAADPDAPPGQGDEAWWEGLTGSSDSAAGGVPAASEPQPVGAADAPVTPIPAKPVKDTGARPEASAEAVMDAGLQALLDGLGLDPDQPLDEVSLRAMGLVFRTLLKGVVDMLRARSDFKNQMRLARTIIQAQDNNPFKMAVNSDDLLDLLFVHPRRGYLAPEDAARETVADLASHELAVFEGLRGMNRELAEKVDPERLEKYFDKQSKFTGGIGILQKARYWDAYAQYYQSQLVDRDALSEAFARVYDESLLQLQKGRG